MNTKKPLAKKALIVALLSTGLAGCIAVPAYGPYYGGPDYAPAPAVVVQPYGYYGYYGHGHRYWR